MSAPAAFQQILVNAVVDDITGHHETERGTVEQRRIGDRVRMPSHSTYKSAPSFNCEAVLYVKLVF